MCRLVISMLLRILFLAVQVWAASQGTNRLPEANKSNDPSAGKQEKTWSDTSFATTPEEQGARDLVKSWCAAYGQSDPERLAAMEMAEVEIVDRFGDWHHSTALIDRERFWREGFDVILRKDFHPECTIEHVRFIRSDVAIVQARVSYDQGISLKGGDRIPPFSEIHTFVLMKISDIWLISAHDIVQKTFLR